jgi:SAM-dependent methyltransferase
MSQYRNNHLTRAQVESYGNTYSKGYFYNQWEYIEKPYLQGKFKSLLEDGAKDYLDLACGRGRILSLGGKYFDNTVGVDISGEMLKYARDACADAKLYQYNIGDIQEIGQFDVITLFRFFLNAEHEVKIQTLEKIKELLKPTGCFIANIHVNKRSPRGYAYRVRNHLGSKNLANTEGYDEIAELLDSIGIAVKEVFWHSYLPRIGLLTDPISKYMLTTLENYCRTSKLIPKSICESFILVCILNKDK